jgi:hypothetical protein
MVRPGEYPLPPVDNDEVIARNRVIRVVRKNAPDGNSTQTGVPSIDVLARDNDRRNRAANRLEIPESREGGELIRTKPALRFPNE